MTNQDNKPIENTADIVTELTHYLTTLASREFDSFFKYCGSSRQVIEGIFQDQKIRFTQPRALNDPLEFSPIMNFSDAQFNYKAYDLDGIIFPSVALFYWVQAIESQINKYGILSLTKIPDSFDMWSHYADGHRGFLIEFKSDFWHYPCMKSKVGDEYEVKRVEYVDEYSINLEQIAEKHKSIPVDVLHSELYFKKTARWEYENEYRMVRPLTDCPSFKVSDKRYPFTDIGVYLFDFTWDCVASITLGANMPPENKVFIAQCCEQHNIPVSQAFIIRDYKDRTGKPSAVPIFALDSFKSKDLLLHERAQSFCTDTVKLRYHDNVDKIKQLTDLPYYTGFESEVKEFYDNAKDKKANEKANEQNTTGR